MSVASHINHSSAPSPEGEAPVAAGPVTLDDLARLAPPDLEALYLDARVPRFADLNGDLVGRMLAAPALPRWMRAVLRRFAAWRWFPWRGKSFSAKGDDPRGEGINRVFGGRFARRWFRFETFMAPSRAGDFTAFQLDYDNPGNPGFIRAIKDEVREVAPGLFLGQAYLMWRGRLRLLLYFGLARR